MCGSYTETIVICHWFGPYNKLTHIATDFRFTYLLAFGCCCFCCLDTFPEACCSCLFISWGSCSIDFNIQTILYILQYISYDCMSKEINAKFSNKSVQGIGAGVQTPSPLNRQSHNQRIHSTFENNSQSLLNNFFVLFFCFFFFLLQFLSILNWMYAWQSSSCNSFPLQLFFFPSVFAICCFVFKRTKIGKIMKGCQQPTCFTNNILHLSCNISMFGVI